MGDGCFSSEWQNSQTLDRSVPRTASPVGTKWEDAQKLGLTNKRHFRGAGGFEMLQILTPLGERL